MLKTLDYTIRIGSATTILYFDFYLYSAYAAHYVYYSTYSLHTHVYRFTTNYQMCKWRKSFKSKKTLSEIVQLVGKVGILWKKQR